MEKGEIREGYEEDECGGLGNKWRNKEGSRGG